MSDKKHYNRRERKHLEKSLGLKKPASEKERREFVDRKIKAGKQIHEQYTELVLNAQAKAASEKESEIMKHLMEDTFDKNGNIIRKGLTYDEAKAFIIRNYELERKRAEKLAKREEKRNATK